MSVVLSFSYSDIVFISHMDSRIVRITNKKETRAHAHMLVGCPFPVCLRQSCQNHQRFHTSPIC